MHFSTALFVLPVKTSVISHLADLFTVKVSCEYKCWMNLRSRTNFPNSSLLSPMEDNIVLVLNVILWSLCNLDCTTSSPIFHWASYVTSTDWNTNFFGDTSSIIFCQINSSLKVAPASNMSWVFWEQIKFTSCPNSSIIFTATDLPFLCYKKITGFYVSFEDYFQLW